MIKYMGPNLCMNCSDPLGTQTAPKYAVIHYNRGFVKTEHCRGFYAITELSVQKFTAIKQFLGLTPMG